MVLVAAVALWTAVVPGCSVDLQDGVGPRVPLPGEGISGVVMRVDQEAQDLSVDLREPESKVVMHSAESDENGRFEFFEVAPGRWEIRVRGEEPQDFDSATLEFIVPDAVQSMTLPILDIHAYGAGLQSPADEATVPVPTPDDPITFRCLLPSRPIESARVQIYDEDGESVWLSPRENTDAWSWDGLGNLDSYQGQPVPAGTYRWRVKFRFLDSVEARVFTRTIHLQ